MRMSNKYSEKFLELGANVLGLGKSKVIMWKLDYPFLKDVKSAFVVTKEEEDKLFEYYLPYFLKAKGKIGVIKELSKAVNERIQYKSDKANYNKEEFWNSPYKIHERAIDDCDGSAVLICYLLRLFGFSPFEVFVRAGEVKLTDGSIIGHAHVIWFDLDTEKWYPVEGSLYPLRTTNYLGKIGLRENDTYSGMPTYFITNDLLSFSTYPVRLVI